MSEYVKVYNPADGTYLGMLENAKLQYNRKKEPLESAKFTLPVDDPKNALCQMGNEVELFDNGTRVELFRIKSTPDAIYTRGGTITYSCEHVLAYLMDNVIYRYFEVGGDGVYTGDVINAYLAKQIVVRWILGTCTFALQKQYTTENKSLLQGILAVPKPFSTEHLWTYDTTVRPFVLNLIEPETEPSCEMRYARNTLEIRKSVDIEQLVTRLYPLGYGEGVNQLGIEDVNSGVPYLDADTISTWGVREGFHQDGTIEDAATLKSVSEAVLEERKNPYIIYKAKAVDLFSLTGEPFDKFDRGKMARINDQEYGILVNARVVEISKKDVRGKPGDIIVTFANQTRSVADTIASLVNRISVSEMNAQGQTIIDTRDFEGNLDKDHPKTFKIPIPNELVKINKFTLDLELTAFRSYSKGAAAGGGGTTTSLSGGGGMSTSGVTGSGIYTTSFPTVSNLTEAAEGSTGNGGAGSTGGTSADVAGVSGSADGSVGSHVHVSGSYLATSHTHSVSGHSHSLNAHQHWYNQIIAHAHYMGDHTHTVSIPAHSHSITIPNHTHNNVPGIYEGPTAENAIVTVDGNTVPTAAFVDGVANLIPYLSKDANGKIERGIKHTVVISTEAETGNDDGLTGVAASVFMQAFVRSQGGGNY